MLPGQTDISFFLIIFLIFSCFYLTFQPILTNLAHKFLFLFCRSFNCRQEVFMTKRKHSPSFDAMVKFFQQHYNFATKQDINRLVDKIDELEKSVKEALLPSEQPASTRAPRKKKVDLTKQSASDAVLEVITDAQTGIKFPEIKAKTGFNDKKLRNIIYRLGKLGKIKNKKRGIYIPA